MKKTTVAVATVLLFLSSGCFPTSDAKEKDQKELPQEEPVKEIRMGEVLKTELFDITVNDAELINYLDTGNEFTDLEAGEGMTFLVLSITFKNVDTESRTVFAGSVELVTPEGKNYLFDKDETMIAEGWGVTFEEINPLTTLTTNIVYKVPADIRGSLYYHPERAAEEEYIFLGDIQEPEK